MQHILSSFHGLRLQTGGHKVGQCSRNRCLNKGISAEFQSHQTIINVAGAGYFADASLKSEFNFFHTEDM